MMKLVAGAFAALGCWPLLVAISMFLRADNDNSMALGWIPLIGAAACFVISLICWFL
jgi:hypothetical protein